jgi:hypothetical protein
MHAIVEYINNLFLGEERYRYLVEFVIFSFFFTLLMILIMEIINFIKTDKYLAKNHYKYWKMTKGNYWQRIEANKYTPKDKRLDKNQAKMFKRWNVLLWIWLIISLTIASIVVVIDLVK